MKITLYCIVTLQKEDIEEWIGLQGLLILKKSDVELDSWYTNLIIYSFSNL